MWATVLQETVLGGARGFQLCLMLERIYHYRKAYSAGLANGASQAFGHFICQVNTASLFRLQSLGL